MQVVRISDTTQYLDLNTLATITAGTSLVITNTTNFPLYVIQDASQPSATTIADICESGEEIIVSGRTGQKVWVKGMESGGPIVVQLAAGATATYSIVDLPEKMYSSLNEGYRRLKVDNGEASYFEGREFRSFYEYSIATGATIYLKFSCSTEFQLRYQAVTCDDGYIRVAAIAGATPSGSWTNQPVVGKNRRSTIIQPAYVSQATFSAGGSATGGSVVEVIRLKTASATAQASTVGHAIDSVRGLPAGDYIISIQNLGNATVNGVYDLYWGE